MRWWPRRRAKKKAGGEEQPVGGEQPTGEERPAGDDRPTGDEKAAGEEQPAIEAAGLVGAVPRADRFTFQDLVAEATSDIGSRPARLVMTTLGTVLGIGSLVATIGFAQTAAGQIASQFDAAAATQVVVTPKETQGRSGQSAAIGRLPWDGPERVMHLAGVEDAALMAEVSLGADGTITAVAVNDPAAAPTAPPTVIAASAGMLDTVVGDVVTGRFFDDGHDERGDRVAVLGARAADRLGINRVDSQPSIFISGIAYAVIGIVDEFENRADLRDAVILPLGAARLDFGVGAPSELRARIVVGAGPQVAEQSVLALAPDSTDTIEARAPAAASDLSRSVQSDISVVLLVLGGIALLAGGLGIANVTLMSVMERIGEIGLRRALGATRRQIGAQFMVESIVIGLLGGLIGSSVGVIAVIVVAALQQWTPVLNPGIAVGGALLGAVVGWAAGWYPARRAARTEPVTALRGGA